MNNFISKYKNTALIAMAVFSLSSCLKDEGAENGTYGMSAFAGGEFVSLPLSANNPNALALESKAGNQTLSLFQANYENVNKAPEDIVVSFTPDAAAVTAAGGLTALPAGTVTYASGSPSVTIAKGTRVSPAFTCQINTSSLDPTKAYGLAFTISSVSKTGVSIPKNLKTVVYKIALKNKFDGVYRVTGPMVDVGSAALTQYLPSWTANLETTGPNSVAVRDMTATGGIFHPIMNGGAPSYYGAFGMVVTFDPATNVATNMVSPYEPAANGRTARLDPTFSSKWDPATKNIRIKYHMFQPGFGGGGPRVFFDETWTYIGPRK
jgi:hypothetical protein